MRLAGPAPTSRNGERTSRLRSRPILRANTRRRSLATPKVRAFVSTANQEPGTQRPTERSPSRRWAVFAGLTGIYQALSFERNPNIKQKLVDWACAAPVRRLCDALCATSVRTPARTPVRTPSSGLCPGLCSTQFLPSLRAVPGAIAGRSRWLTLVLRPCIPRPRPTATEDASPSCSGSSASVATTSRSRSRSHHSSRSGPAETRRVSLCCATRSTPALATQPPLARSQRQRRSALPQGPPRRPRPLRFTLTPGRAAGLCGRTPDRLRPWGLSGQWARGRAR